MNFCVENISLISLQTGALVFTRCLGMICFVPVFSGIEVSKLTRFLLAFLLTILVTPSLLLNEVFASDIVALSSTPLLFVVSLFKEAAWGSVIGLTLKIFFESVNFAGETIAKIGGISVAGSFDHLLGEETSSISRLLFWIALSTFVLVRGCELFIDGFLNVFFTVPPTGSTELGSVIECLGIVLTASFSLGLKIAAPVILSTLSVYIFIGVAGRVFPQMNLTTIGFSCNSLLTLIVLSLGISGCCLCFQDELVKILERVFIVDG